MYLIFYVAFLIFSSVNNNYFVISSLSVDHYLLQRLKRFYSDSRNSATICNPPMYPNRK